MPTIDSENDSNSIFSILTDRPLSAGNQGYSAALKEIVRLTRLATNLHTCTLTTVNLKDRTVSQIAFSSKDKEFEEYLKRRREVPVDVNKLDFGKHKFGISYAVASRGNPYESTSLQLDGGGVANPQIARKYRLHSFYCHPVKINNQLKGYINLFSVTKNHIPTNIRQLIELIAMLAEVPISQYEIRKRQNQDLRDAIEAMARLTDKEKADEILKITLKYARKLIGDEHYASILILDDKTGQLREVKAYPAVTSHAQMTFGIGYCSRALMEGHEIFADSSSPDWDQTYVGVWNPNICSEMAIPLIIKNEQILVGKEKRSTFRPIGVLNFESESMGIFTQEEINILLPLISQASLLIEKSSIETKLDTLRETERKLSTNNWEDPLKIIAYGIRESLGFKIINISLVDYQKNTIGTEVIIGLDSEERTEKFIKMAVHSLDSTDIQAAIVKSKNPQPEAPDENDERFDKAILEEFEHKDFVRVFVPIISSVSGQCLGTIEAGYEKGLRKHIYQSDIKILQGFAELAVEAIIKRRANLLDKIFHEMQSPIAGIEGHTDFLERGFHKLSPWEIEIKLEDINLDCEILRQNIEEMKYFMGKQSTRPVIEQVKVMKDIVFKTVNQLRSRIRESALVVENMRYRTEDTSKIEVYVDRVKINQVVYNLLINSIRYASRYPNEFRIEVIADEEDQFYVIKFRDWGIGVREEFRKRIFEDYFRAPDAEKRAKGTGLGLPISRKIMRDIGGDVILVNLAKPTEFQVKIPKKYLNPPKGYRKR